MTKDIDSNAKKAGKEKNIAIVHDFLLYPGGAERVLMDIATLFPQAPIYTLLYDEKRMGEYFPPERIRTSFLQKSPHVVRHKHRYLLPFYGTAVESFDLRDFDVVVSSSGAWSKGIVTRLHTKHIAYIHSPMRYVWDENEKYLKQAKGVKNNFCVRALLSYLRVWDHQAAQRPDVLVANSFYTKKRIQKYYRRDAHVVYPSVSIKPVESNKPFPYDYFLIIARLSRYKNVALAIETCNKLKLPLIVVGEGREQKNLEKLAGNTIKMLGWVNEKEKACLLTHARALLFPSEDDFGIVCAEAVSVGTPVIALRRGGACEIVKEGVGGEFFDAPLVGVMADALRRFLEKEEIYNRKKIMASATNYTSERFTNEMREIIDNA